MNFLQDSKSKTIIGGALVIFILASVASCTSCRNDNVLPKPSPTPTVTPSVIVPPVPTTQEVESSGIRVTLPITFVDQHAETADDSDYRLFANMNGKELTSLDASKYDNSYEEYVIEGTRFVKDTGGVIQSTEKINISGQEFVVIEASKNGVVAWYWLTTKNGFGYTFTCGGEESAGKALHDTCFGFAGTLTIK